MLSTTFLFIWPSDYREEYSLEINQSKSRIVCDGHVCYQIAMKWPLFIEVSEETIF